MDILAVDFYTKVDVAFVQDISDWSVLSSDLFLVYGGLESDMLGLD